MRERERVEVSDGDSWSGVLGDRIGIENGT